MTDQIGLELAVEKNVERLFDVLQRLGDADLLMLRSYWDNVDQSAREQAWIAASRAIAAARRESLLDDARSSLATWVNNYEAAYGVLGGGSGGTEGIAPGTVRQAAIPPILDAVVATIADDGISDDEVLTLCQPMIQIGVTLSPITDEPHD